jgi:hypothetical protein
VRPAGPLTGSTHQFKEGTDPMTESVTPKAPILRDVTALVVGDVIAAPWLPLRRQGRVIFTRRFVRRGGERWVFVAYQTDGGIDGTSFLVGEGVRLDVAADLSGLLHSRADDGDDPTPPGERQPARTGVMTDEGLVAETEAGLIVGDTAAEQRDNAYAAYERDEARGWPGSHVKGCKGAVGLPCTCPKPSEIA